MGGLICICSEVDMMQRPIGSLGAPWDPWGSRASWRGPGGDAREVFGGYLGVLGVSGGTGGSQGSQGPRDPPGLLFVGASGSVLPSSNREATSKEIVKRK